MDNVCDSVNNGPIYLFLQEAPIDRDIKGCAELGSIKDRFEKGEAYNIGDIKRTIDDYRELKSGAKQMFLASAAPAGGAGGDDKSPRAPISRKSLLGDSAINAEDSQEVMALINRFKHIETEVTERKAHRITPPPEGYKFVLHDFRYTHLHQSRTRIGGQGTWRRRSWIRRRGVPTGGGHEEPEGAVRAAHAAPCRLGEQ